MASLAHTDLLDLRVEFFPYQPCAGRVWELRENVTCYDGWYVAVAELLDAPLAETLDGRLATRRGLAVVAGRRRYMTMSAACRPPSSSPYFFTTA